ncbi:MAG: RNA methyltransferase [Candidatus Verstraetearchaeota archaeon]|nr:RNA methyltransferase [Candidatus Verstraetearchaeota archaeon]
MKRNCKLTVFFPSSILSDVPSLAEKSFKIGQIARAASIFRVEGVTVYPDGPNWRRDAKLVYELLSYAETPQYLRKRLFPISPWLRYAGLIPPLRTPHHPLGNEDVRYREGLVIESGANGSVVDIGLKHPVRLGGRLPRNARVTMCLTEAGWIPVRKESVPMYWGYVPAIDERPLHKILADRPGDLVIATSRKGKPLHAVAGELSDALKRSGSVAIFFGSPKEGLHEILHSEGKSLDGLADMVVNIAPNQGSATIRTEEAITITLAIMDFVEGIPLDPSLLVPSGEPTESKRSNTRDG